MHHAHTPTAPNTASSTRLTLAAVPAHSSSTSRFQRRLRGCSMLVRGALQAPRSTGILCPILVSIRLCSCVSLLSYFVPSPTICFYLSGSTCESLAAVEYPVVSYSFCLYSVIRGLPCPKHSPAARPRETVPGKCRPTLETKKRRGRTPPPSMTFCIGLS